VSKWDESKYRHEISEAKCALGRAIELLELLDPRDSSAPAVWTAVEAAFQVAKLRLRDAQETLPRKRDCR
jgi:hypothetical protein